MLHWPRISCLRRWCWPMIVVLLVALLVVAVAYLERIRQQAIEFARGLECQGNVRSLGIAFFMYNQRYGCLPPAYVDEPNGSRMHSWRALIREEICDPGFHYNFDEPWNSPNNLKLGDDRLDVYTCPSDQATCANKRLTNYFVIVGPNTLFPGSHTTSIIKQPDSMHLSNTILVAEARGLNIEWLEPQDLNYSTMSFTINDPNQPCISSPHPQGCNVRMADGSLRFLSKDIDPEVLKQMLSADKSTWRENEPDNDFDGTKK